MKRLTYQEAEQKIRRYCAYQERSHSEVRMKLNSFNLPGDQIEEIITLLITTGFLNEERFARSFAGGKFRMKKWGRLKIAAALEAKGLSDNCISAGLKEIENGDYDQTLRKIISERSDHSEEKNIFLKRDRLSKYAIARGYEPELVWKILKELFPDQR